MSDEFDALLRIEKTLSAISDTLSESFHVLDQLGARFDQDDPGWINAWPAGWWTDRMFLDRAIYQWCCHVRFYCCF